MHICKNKRKRLQKKRAPLPQDQRGHRFIVVEHQHGHHDVMWKRSIGTMLPIFSEMTYWADLLFFCCISCNTSGLASITWLIVSNTWSPTSAVVTFVLTTLSRMFAVYDKSPRTNSDGLEVIFLTSFKTLSALVFVTGTWNRSKACCLKLAIR